MPIIQAPKTFQTTLSSPDIVQIGLDELIPSLLTGTSQNIVNKLLENNCRLAKQIIDIYYKIKTNVEYISVGKSSLYPLRTPYSTSGKSNINSLNSRQYFYYIHKYSNLSFGYVISLAVYVLQNNKISLEQNSKGLQGKPLFKIN